MSKNALLALIGFGGLIIVAALLLNTAADDTKDSPAAPEDASLPSEVTSNFPTYPSSTISNQRESTSEDGRTFYSFSLTATASISDINQWYREALSSNGWAITSDKNIGGYQIIQGEKENLFTSIQAASGKEAGTAVISQQAQIRP